MNIFDVDILWNVFLENAKIYRDKKEVFLSPRQSAPYLVSNIENEVVTINRLSSPGSYERVGKDKFRTCIRRLNKAYPNTIAKTTLYEHVVEETAIVELLPMLDWSEDGKTIVVDTDVLNNGGETPKADRKARYTQVAMRQGQQKLRAKLFILYDGQCAISGCRLPEVLHACHITPFNKSKVCLAEDAILLRSDLHDLFDSDLLAIHPETKQVYVHHSILTSQYREFHKQPLRERKDKGAIMRLGLVERWQDFRGK